MTSTAPEGDGRDLLRGLSLGSRSWNFESDTHPLLPFALLLSCFSPHFLSVFPRHTHALALDVVRSAFHALLIAAIPVAVGWFVSNHFLHPPRQMKDQEDERDSGSEQSQQPTQTTRPIHADPPLQLTDLTLSFSRSSGHEIAVLSPLPRVPLPPKRVSRKLSRPSTASILDERRNLLPTSSSSGSLTDNSPIGTPATDNDSSWPSTSPDPLPGESVTGDKLTAEIGIPLPDTIAESFVVDDRDCSLTGALVLPGGPFVHPLSRVELPQIDYRPFPYAPFKWTTLTAM
jgi:hypothetical protein